MSTYNINGHDCTFPSVPFGELQKYQPTPSTFILAWAAPRDAVHQMAITLLLDSAYLLGGLQRPPYLIETTEKRTIYLLEQPNRQLLEEHVCMWLGYLSVAYTYACPYTIALKAELQQGDDKIKEIDDWLSYRNHPLYLEYKRWESIAQKQSATFFPDNWINHKVNG